MVDLIFKISMTCLVGGMGVIFSIFTGGTVLGCIKMLWEKGDKIGVFLFSLLGFSMWAGVTGLFLAITLSYWA